MPETTASDPRPSPPLRPDNDECCRSGCDSCVFQLYQDALDRYRAALQDWEQRQIVIDKKKVRPTRRSS